MPRNEFGKATKREALKRSGGLCEGAGLLHGLPIGVRCRRDLAHGVEFDHRDLDANSKDASLNNCAALCPACHKFKTTKHDIPRAAKTLRQQDKANGIRGRGRPMPGSRNSEWKRKIGGRWERRT